MTFSRYVLLGALFAPAIAGPAAAEDCFPKVQAAISRPAAPAKPVHRVAKPAAKPAVSVQPASKPVVRKVKRVRAAAKPLAPRQHLLDSSFDMRTAALPAPRSTECDTKPSIQAALPEEARPPAQRLLDEIAGPPENAALTPMPVLASAAPEGGGIGFPLFGGGGGGGGAGYIPPSGGVTPGVPGTPGEPEVPTTPTTPTEPNEPTPPVIPPTPPVINPPTPGTPCPGPGPCTGGPGGPVVSPIPEPATWAMMIVGFFGLGAAVRAKRAGLRLEA